MAIRDAVKRTRMKPAKGTPGEGGLCRIGQAATYLAVSNRTIETLIHTGRLASVKIGRSRRIRWASVLEFSQSPRKLEAEPATPTVIHVDADALRDVIREVVREVLHTQGR